MGLTNFIHEFLEFVGATSLIVSTSVGLTAIVLDAVDRRREAPVRR
jgi:hypothetical protein